MEFFKYKRVLVTGASGFIGGALTRCLLDQGARVFASLHKTPVEISHSNLHLIDCDLGNVGDTLNLVNQSKPQLVFHLAAYPIVDQCENDIFSATYSNINGTVNLMYALKDHHPESIVVASTDKVYGRHDYLPYEEQMQLKGNFQWYETTKLCQENIAQHAANNWKLPVAITRCGNVYGPGDLHTSRIIPGTIQAYLNDEEVVIRSNGQYYRDYVYIDDIVDGYLTLSKFESERRNLNIFNFGTGQPSRVLDIVTLIGSFFPKIKPPTILNQASSEIKSQYVDTSKAYYYLGWSANTRLKDGIFNTIEWHKSRM